jgi:hypothetical protein
MSILRDDDDEFLYGDSELKESSLSQVPAGILASAGETFFFCTLAEARPSCILLVPTKYNRHFAHFFLVCASVEPDE